jgi:hypothetical protein
MRFLATDARNVLNIAMGAAPNIKSGGFLMKKRKLPKRNSGIMKARSEAPLMTGFT